MWCNGDPLVHEGSSDVGQLPGLVRERQNGPYLGQVRRCLLTQLVLVNIQNTVSVFKIINIHLKTNRVEFSRNLILSEEPRHLFDEPAWSNVGDHLANEGSRIVRHEYVSQLYPHSVVIDA